MPARTFLMARLPFVDLRVAFFTPLAVPFVAVPFVAVPLLPTTVAGATFSEVGTNPGSAAAWKGVSTAADDFPLFLTFALLDTGATSDVEVRVVPVPVPVKATFFVTIERRAPVLFERVFIIVAFLAAVAFLAGADFLTTDFFTAAGATVKERLATDARAATAFLATETFLPVMLAFRGERVARVVPDERFARIAAAFFATPARFAATDLLRAAFTRDFIADPEALIEVDELFATAASAELRSKSAVGSTSAPIRDETMRPRRTRVRLIFFLFTVRPFL